MKKFYRLEIVGFRNGSLVGFCDRNIFVSYYLVIGYFWV